MIKKYPLLCVYGFLIVFFVSVFSYNFGHNQGVRSQNRPIYVKYTNNVNKSLSVSLYQAGIFAEPERVEMLGKILKEGGKRAR